MIIVAPALWLEQMVVLQRAGVTLTEVRKLSPVLAVFMLSSAAGKYTALTMGIEATRRFCRLNLAATSILVLMCLAQRDWIGMLTWGFFAGAYAAIGFSARVATTPAPARLVAVWRWWATPVRLCAAAAAFVLLVGLVAVGVSNAAEMWTVFLRRCEGSGLPSALR